MICPIRFRPYVSSAKLGHTPNAGRQSSSKYQVPWLPVAPVTIGCKAARERDRFYLIDFKKTDQHVVPFQEIAE
jgi:hypothetical protein